MAPRKASKTGFVSGRQIHLIDIENLCGVPRPSEADVADARIRYQEAVPNNPTDHVVIASSRGNLLNVSLGWPGARYLVRDGKDGADICLSEVIEDERLPLRFDQVFLATGDGGLAVSVSKLAEAGVHTVVVARQERLSRMLRMAAHACIVLTPELKEIA